MSPTGRGCLPPGVQVRQKDSSTEASPQGFAGGLGAGPVGSSLQPTMEPEYPFFPKGQSPHLPPARDPREQARHDR